MKILTTKLWQCDCGVLNMTESKKCTYCDRPGPYENVEPSQQPPIDTESETDILPAIKIDEVTEDKRI